VPIVAVAQDVAAANQSGSGGAMVADGQQISLATHGQFARLRQLADLPIAVCRTRM
jgi:multidrug efflux pump subunit AcrB